MTSLKNLKQNHVEYAFIGASTTNLILAHVVKNNGGTPFIFESLETLFVGSDQHCDNSFNLIKDLPEHREQLAWAQEVTGITLKWNPTETPTTTLMKSELIPFLGFAEDSPTSVDILSNYIGSQWLALEQPRETLRKSLIQSLEDHIYTLSEVSDWQITDQKVTGFTLNGNKTLSVDHLFLSEFPNLSSDLKPLFPKKFNTKFRPWTAVQISISHSKVEAETWPQTPGYILIPGGKKSEFQPCIGQFHTSSNPASDDEDHLLHTSFWRGFAPADVEEDSDYMGGLVRHLKKSLKKVLSFDEKNSSLKVTVTPYSHGHFTEVSAADHFLERGQLVCVHPCLSPYEDLIGEIDMARRVISEKNLGNSEKVSDSNHLDINAPNFSSASPEPSSLEI